MKSLNNFMENFKTLNTELGNTFLTHEFPVLLLVLSNNEEKGCFFKL